MLQQGVIAEQHEAGQQHQNANAYESGWLHPQVRLPFFFIIPKFLGSAQTPNRKPFFGDQTS